MMKSKGVFKVTDLETRQKEWFVGDYDKLIEVLEKKYGQNSIRIDIKMITRNIPDFLQNQSDYEELYMKEKKND